MFSVLFFFFSSRRRHTRCSRDWSSDVCSSDLDGPRDLGGGKRGGRDLVEQRGEQVMIGAIDHRQLERRLAQGLGSPQTAETAAQDDHAGGRHAAMIQVVTKFTGIRYSLWVLRR